MTALAAGNKKVAFKWVWIAIAAVIIIAGMVTPEWAGLSQAGKMGILVMLSSIILWATEALPLAATALGMMALLPFLGVLDASTTWAAMLNSSMVLFIGVFAFTTFLGEATFPQRLIAVILKITKGNTSLVILGFMIIGAIISTVMSNIALTAVLCGIAMPLLESNGDKAGESRFGRCLMIAIPFGVMLGGCLLPSGTPINVLALGLVEANYGVSVTFVQWFLVTVIPVVIMLIGSWFLLVKIYKPEPISKEAVEAAIARAAKMPPMEKKEIYNIGVIVVTLVLWIASSWLPVLNTSCIALLALAAMFLPGLSMITIQDYRTKSPWEILLMMMAVNALVAGISKNGGSDWIVSTLLAPLTGMPYIGIIILCSIILAALHNVIPAGPAVAGLVTLPFVSLAAAVSGNISAMLFVVTFWSALAFIVPLDSVLLVSYANGFYKFNELWKGGLPVTVLCLVVACVLLPIICPLLGLA